MGAKTNRQEPTTGWVEMRNSEGRLLFEVHPSLWVRTIKRGQLETVDISSLVDYETVLRLLLGREIKRVTLEHLSDRVASEMIMSAVNLMY